MNVYVIGSLRNPEIPNIANRIEKAGFEVFADWFGAGEMADDRWQAYEQARGFNYQQALQRPAAKNVFEFDLRHLTKADAVVLVLPAGKSGHLEFGWARGQGKPGYILFDKEPERWDVMTQFASGVCFSLDELVSRMRSDLLNQREISWMAVGTPEQTSMPVSDCPCVHCRIARGDN